MSNQNISNPKNSLNDHLNKSPQRRKRKGETSAISEIVYTRLRDAIHSAELRPNRRLVEDDVAEWLGVSRTPVREALLRLEQEKLVERNRGWIVREHNPIEIRARLECRLVLEGFSARLAAERRSGTILEQLCVLADEMEHPGISRRDFNRLNDEFHNVIVEAAGNPTLAHLHSQIKLNYWDLSVPVIFSKDIYEKIHVQHRDLIDAIASRDGDTAEKIARNHVEITKEIVISALNLVD